MPIPRVMSKVMSEKAGTIVAVVNQPSRVATNGSLATPTAIGVKGHNIYLVVIRIYIIPCRDCRGISRGHPRLIRSAVRIGERYCKPTRCGKGKVQLIKRILMIEGVGSLGNIQERV